MMPIRRAKCCLSIGMVAGVTATLFAGVGVSSASEVYASKPVASQTENSITIQVESGDSAEENCYINVFKQQNPGVSVTTSIVSPLAEEGANLTVLTSSNPPDVGAIATNTAVFARMLAANDLSPIHRCGRLTTLTRLMVPTPPSSTNQKAFPMWFRRMIPFTISFFTTPAYSRNWEFLNLSTTGSAPLANS